jgi:APA family basic amino acid/polyamine antiporter
LVAEPAGYALNREIGLGGAVITGLGSILGTGAFVSIGLAAGKPPINLTGL